MSVSLEAIQRLLYEHAKDRIVKSYGFPEEPANLEHFSRMLVGSLNQAVKPVRRPVSNAELFEAAVKSIGSNSRDWSKFIAKEPRLREVLSEYDPLAVAGHEEQSLLHRLREFFPGTSCGTDCRSVLAWARKLAEIPDYYGGVILQVADAFERLHGEELSDDRLIICLSGFLSAPSGSWPGFRQVTTLPSSKREELLKLNGMGYPLASEFFRNLGWNGFKPDRHIKRLLAYWYDVDRMATEQEISFYTRLIGRAHKELIDNIRFSIVGQKISPPGVPFSQVDNFIWALGAYVMKKGKERQLSAVL